jgi:3-hydroxybutyryl-CoA dehydrogenase
MNKIETIGVIGAGQMGGGIAQIAAQAGAQVKLVDINDAAIERGIGAIDKSLSKLVARGKMNEDAKAATMGRITTSTDYGVFGDVGVVIEAAPEVFALKVTVFAELAQKTTADCLFASNTSSLPITKLAATTDRPNKFIGLHFFNPVPLMPLVEIVRGVATDDTTNDAITALTEAFGKTAVIAQDSPGFVVNRVLLPMINEAVQTLYEGVGTVRDIDTAMQLGTNQPMGPLTLADFIGLDTCLAIMQVLHDGFGDSKYRPSPLLVKYVQAGWLGRKSGKGFYDYGQDPPAPTC